MNFICLVTARKGVGLVCADYQGSGAKIVLDSTQNDDETSAEYEDDTDRIIVKTEKVTNAI